MKLILDINIQPPEKRIEYGEKIFLIGSCFTEHIGGRLSDVKFPVLQNPNGILFDPVSVSRSLTDYIENDSFAEADLFHLNELWQSWQHHSQFSGMNKDRVLEVINDQRKKAHSFLKEADWLIITLGSSFSYRLTENGEPVANCHRAPAQWFRKHLLSIEETVTSLDTMLHRLFSFNNKLKIIFTVSPVRHIRDGIVENNRSKARLLETVHHLVNKYESLYYFPAYELVIDVLRDYRFYDVDLVHPNYAATEFVFEHFREHFISSTSNQLMEEIRKFVTASKHKAFQPATAAHRQFLQNNLQRIQQFQQKNPQIDFSNEIRFFSDAMEST